MELNSTQHPGQKVEPHEVVSADIDQSQLPAVRPVFLFPLLVIVAVVTILLLAPIIGGYIQVAQPTLSVTSPWNLICNINVQIVSLLVTIIIIILILAHLIRIKSE